MGKLVVFVGSGLVAGLAGAAWFWGAVWSWLVGAWDAMGGHLSQSMTLQMWALYLLAFLSAHRVISWAWRLIPDKTLKHTRFTQDSFFGASWRWKYDMSGHPSDPVARCPECSMRAVYSESGGMFEAMGKHVQLHCERCATRLTDQPGSLDDLQSRVLREVDRLISTGEWESRAP